VPIPAGDVVRLGFDRAFDSPIVVGILCDAIEMSVSTIVPASSTARMRSALSCTVDPNFPVYVVHRESGRRG